MLSKFLSIRQRIQPSLFRQSRAILNRPLIRVSSGLIPPSQYDRPFPRKFKLGYALSVYWELWPIIITTGFVLGILLGYIVWSLKNKVDIVFSTNCRNNISRTMDLTNPSIHKFVVINQEYLPWPELAGVLEKMKAAEKRALSRAQSCNHP